MDDTTAIERCQAGNPDAFKHLDGLSYQALAERLEIPPGTVMSRLYWARQRLRAEMNRGREKL